MLTSHSHSSMAPHSCFRLIQCRKAASTSRPFKNITEWTQWQDQTLKRMERAKPSTVAQPPPSPPSPSHPSKKPITSSTEKSGIRTPASPPNSALALFGGITPVNASASQASESYKNSQKENVPTLEVLAGLRDHLLRLGWKEPQEDPDEIDGSGESSAQDVGKRSSGRRRRHRKTVWQKIVGKIRSPPPPLTEYNSRERSLTVESRFLLDRYYQTTLRHALRFRRETHLAFCRRRAIRRRRKRESRRVDERNTHAEDQFQIFQGAKEQADINHALNAFRCFQKRHYPVPTNQQRNEGWPPESAVLLGRLPPFRRELYAFNRRSADGQHYEPVLAICVKQEPVLLLTYHEVVNLQEIIPMLKAEGESLKKKWDLSRRLARSSTLASNRSSMLLGSATEKKRVTQKRS